MRFYFRRLADCDTGIEALSARLHAQVLHARLAARRLDSTESN